MARESSSNQLWLLSCLIACLALGGVLAVTLLQRADAPILLDESLRRAGLANTRVESRIDPNTAEWYDLTRLPRVGEGMARSIVAYRQARTLEWRSTHPDAPPSEAPAVFRAAEDLLVIRGIGPKTLERLRPHLLLPTDAPTSRATR